MGESEAKKRRFIWRGSLMFGMGLGGKKMNRSQLQRIPKNFACISVGFLIPLRSCTSEASAPGEPGSSHVDVLFEKRGPLADAHFKCFWEGLGADFWGSHFLLMKIPAPFWQSIPQGKTAWVVPTLPDESRIALWAISSAKTMKLMSLMSHWTMQFLGSNNTIAALLLFHFRFSFLRCPDRSNALLQHCGYPVMPFGQPLVHKRNDLTWYATAWMPGLSLCEHVKTFLMVILGFGDIEKSEGLDFVEIFSGHIDFLGIIQCKPRFQWY